MITADCPDGRRRKRDRIWRGCRAAFAAVLVFFGVKMQSQAETPKTGSQQLQKREAVIMGDICPPVAGGIFVPPATNKPVPPKVSKTNAPPPVIMGKIAVPKQTNAPAKGKP